MFAIRAVATAGEPGEIFCQVSNAQFQRFPAKFHEICTQHADRCRDKNFRNRTLKILSAGVVFPKNAKLSQTF